MFVTWVAAFITARTCIILRLSNDKISLSCHLTLHYDICSIISIYSSMHCVYDYPWEIAMLVPCMFGAAAVKTPS